MTDLEIRKLINNINVKISRVEHFRATKDKTKDAEIQELKNELFRKKYFLENLLKAKRGER